MNTNDIINRSIDLCINYINKLQLGIVDDIFCKLNTLNIIRNIINNDINNNIIL